MNDIFSGRRCAVLALIGVISINLGFAQVHPAAPALSSNPGARYKIYLNFCGFNYSGTWAGRTPGNVPAYTVDGDATTFNPTEIQRIKEVWARTSAAYVGFNIDVTTIDPAANGLTDAERQTYYDATQYLTHTIIGGANTWYGSAGGVSYVGVAQQPTALPGRRTNWVFPANGTGTGSKNIAVATIHEDGHHLRLPHQSDETTGAGYSYNNNASGNGSYAPIMGVAYNSQRGTWRVGRAGTNKNDVLELQANTNMGPLIDSGIGHTLTSATPLAVQADGTINSAVSKGWIMPKASTGYSAVGEDSYTKDVFSFRTLGGQVSITANDGTSFLQAGVADPGATMRCVMRILDSNGGLLGVATEDATTLRHTWTGNLASGDYYAEVASYGAYVSSYEPDSRYFNMGGYFMSGSGFTPVPEPTSMLALTAGISFLFRRRKQHS